MVEKILFDRVDDEMEKVVFFVEKECYSEIAYLFFGVFCGGNEVDGFEVAKVDVPAKDVDIKKLCAAAALG